MQLVREAPNVGECYQAGGYRPQEALVHQSGILVVPVIAWPYKHTSSRWERKQGATEYCGAHDQLFVCLVRDLFTALARGFLG